MLTRAKERQKELTVRAALGAGRERLVRQMLTESLVLALLGGAAGVMLAISGLPLLASFVPAGIPVGEAAIDIRAFLFAALMTGAAGVGFGIIPAFGVVRRQTSRHYERNREPGDRIRTPHSRTLANSIARSGISNRKRTDREYAFADLQVCDSPAATGLLLAHSAGSTSPARSE
jgi:hypothetical protein